MKNMLLEEKYILMYVKDILHELKINSSSVQNAKYHHNSCYKDAASICKYGILTPIDLNKLLIKKYDENYLSLMGDIESHANGDSAVSLSVVGLNDLYSNEDEYNPLDPNKVDFLVSSNVNAGRSSVNYGNEFLSYNSILPSMIRSVDIRILKLIEMMERNKPSTIGNIIEIYNQLREIAVAMKDSKLDIPLREMSYQDNFSLDIDRLSLQPKLMLKK